MSLNPPKVPNYSRAFFKVISCTTAGEIARALLAEGCVLPSVQKLGRVFRAKHMDNLCEQEIPILRQVEIYRFTIPIADDDDLGVKDFEQEIVLPHELFATLFEHHHDFFRRVHCFALYFLDIIRIRRFGSFSVLGRFCNSLMIFDCNSLCF